MKPAELKLDDPEVPCAPYLRALVPKARAVMSCTAFKPESSNTECRNFVGLLILHKETCTSQNV